jgi:uncharacterized protein (TIGR00369 family)
MMTIEAVRERLAGSPFNGLLGLEPLAVEPQLILRLPANPIFEGRPGSNILHGGVVASLIDVACAMAVVTKTGGIAATIDLSIDYLAPATVEPLTATVEILRNGRTLATTLTRVADAHGRAIAIGRAALKHMGPWTAGTA